MSTPDRPSTTACLALAALVGGALTAAASIATAGGCQQPGSHGAPERAAFGAPEEVLLIRAGRPVPVGLTVSRTNDRKSERAAALEELRLALGEESPQHDPWLARLGSVLSSPNSPRATWTAAALVVGELGQYELAPLVAAGLDEPWDDPGQRAFGRRRWAARRALYQLYGSWFDSHTEWQVWVEEMQACLPSAGLFAELRARDEAAVETLRRLLPYEPETALARLSDPDPSLRERAAEVLPGALSNGTLEAAAILEALIARLEVEVDPGAYHAVLQALLDVLGEVGVVADRDATRMALLRHLEAAVGSARTEVALPLARALERMPWDAPWDTVEGAEEGQRFGAAFGARSLASLLSDLALLGPRGDADVTIDVLGALQNLLARAGEGVEAARDAARLPVLTLVQNPTLALSVRSAAASAAATLVTPADAHALVLVLSQEGTPVDLRYALLGALGRLARGLDPQSPLGSEVADSLLAAVADAETDLRGRALALLADPELAGLLAQRDLSLLVERLRTESVPELRQQVIALLRAHPRPEVLGDVLALPELDDLAKGDPRQIAELAGMFGDLAAGRPAETVAAARRLVQVDDEPTELLRRQKALGLVAGLDDEAIAALDADSHRDIVAWAVAYRGPGLSLNDALEDGDALLRRLVDSHLPGSAGATGAMTEASRAHVSALFLGDLLDGGEDGVEVIEVRRAFDSALASAGADPDAALVLRVQRDRARFLLAQGNGAGALQDYRALIFPGGSSGGLAPFVELLLADLRDAAALLAAPGVTDEAVRRMRSGQAFDVLLHLITRPAWGREPAAVRMQDLEDLLLRATESGDQARIQRFEELLDGLPEAPPAADPDAPNGSIAPAAAPRRAIWAGLAAAGRGSELRSLLERARAAQRTPEPPVVLPADEPPDRRGEAPPGSERGGGASRGG